MKHPYLPLLYLYFITCLCCACGSHEASSQIPQANTLLDKVLTNGVLRVGTTGDYKPFSFRRNDSSALQGIDIVMAEDLAESLGVQVTFVQTSWPTLIDDFQQGKFDIGMSGITIKLERQQIGMFSMPIFEGGKAPICRDEDANRFSSLDSINQAGVRVIFNPGGTNETYARSHFPKAILIENKDNLSVFQRIVDKEADVMVTDAIETRIQEKVHPELEAVHPDKPFNVSEKGYLMPRDLVWKAYVDQWLHLRQKQGVIDSVFKAEMDQLLDLYQE